MPMVDYWDVIEADFERVDIYHGRRRFLSQVVPLAPHIRHLLCVHWCDSEVCNGGFWQLHFNSTGVLLPEATAGFRAIGRPDLASLAERAHERLGTSFSGSRWIRQRRLRRLVHKELGFDDLDEAYYEACDQNDLRESMNKYAEQFVR